MYALALRYNPLLWAATDRRSHRLSSGACVFKDNLALSPFAPLPNLPAEDIRRKREKPEIYMKQISPLTNVMNEGSSLPAGRTRQIHHRTSRRTVGVGLVKHGLCTTQMAVRPPPPLPFVKWSTRTIHTIYTVLLQKQGMAKSGNQSRTRRRERSAPAVDENNDWKNINPAKVLFLFGSYCTKIEKTSTVEQIRNRSVF